MKEFLKILSIFIVSFLISIFIHECTHGLCAYFSDFPVSTGFNKVGMAYKYPNDIDFRVGFENYHNPYDLGPTMTLLLAVAFTVLYVKNKNKNKNVTVFLFGMAIMNSLLRLIPMTISYISLLLRGRFITEDEIGTGVQWYNMTGYALIQYLPSILSILISIVCLYFIINKTRKQKPLVKSKGIIILSITLAFVFGYIFARFLDNIIRINWV